MKKLESAAYAYRLAGFSDRVIQRRLMGEHKATESEATSAVEYLKRINSEALPIPQVTCYWFPNHGVSSFVPVEGDPNDEMCWWQDNNFQDQFDVIPRSECEQRERFAIMLGHIVHRHAPE